MPDANDDDLLLTGNLVFADRVIEDGWLTVRGGRISAFGDGEQPTAAARADYPGMWLMPGCVDGHTHASSIKGWDGIETMTRAAATGGTTTCVDMPYDVPVMVATGDLLRQKAEKVDELAHVDMALYGTMEKTDGLGALEGVIEAGACALKFSTYENSPTRFPRIAHDDLFEAMRIAARHNIPVSIHNEDQELIDALIARFLEEGKTGAEWHEPSRPALSELLANLEVFEIGADAGARVHLAHSSLARGFDQAAEYRERGHAMTAETCVHYLIFDNEAVVATGPKMKVNPPIRPAAEREALWARLLDDKIGFVSSDHAPWPYEKKQAEVIFDNPSGARGIDTLLTAFYDEAVSRRGHPVTLAARYLAEAPARHFGLWPRKGSLNSGADADIAVIDPAKVWTFDEANIDDWLKWSIFHGRQFTGKVAATYVRGTLVYDGEAVVGAKGHGTFVPPVA